MITSKQLIRKLNKMKKNLKWLKHHNGDIKKINALKISIECTQTLLGWNQMIMGERKEETHEQRNNNSKYGQQKS